MSDSAPHPRFPLDPAADSPAAPVPFDPPRPPAVPTARGDTGFALSLDAEALGERARGIPILGGLAAIFGISALFQAPLVLGPLAIGFGLAALCRRQVSLGTIGGVSGLVGLLISPVFWALLGLGWLWSWLLG